MTGLGGRTQQGLLRAGGFGQGRAEGESESGECWEAWPPRSGLNFSYDTWGHRG